MPELEKLLIETERVSQINNENNCSCDRISRSARFE